MAGVERPIAEILGWRRHKYAERIWRRPDGRNSLHGPTVDDMRRWLVDQGAFVACADVLGAPITLEVKVAEWAFDGGYYRHIRGDSLDEVYAAAVRAVAGLREDTDQ